mmetsp:Transcript_64318/g.143042  ORF Transcript_64318/g.143042 Transcript_64318/m.143042 type:complete len:516 (+) Transcript_64318:102-1649(+)
MAYADELGGDFGDFEPALPPRGWSMKRGHRHRLEAALCRKSKKAHHNHEISFGRAVAKRTVNANSRGRWRETYGEDIWGQTRRNELRRTMKEALCEAEDVRCSYVTQEWDEATWEDYDELCLSAKETTDDHFEVSFECGSTTAGSECTAESDMAPSESFQPTAFNEDKLVDDALSEPGALDGSVSAANTSLCLSPWMAAVLRAELAARHYALNWPLPVTICESRKKKKKEEDLDPATRKKREAAKFLSQLSQQYQVDMHYTSPDQTAFPATTFETLRWQFLKDYGHEICGPLSSCYVSTGKQWMIRPAPVSTDVENRFLGAWKKARPGQLQPALHGTHEDNLGSIYARGLLIPGGGNGVKVAHGSAYGVGIYTAYAKDPSLSWSYSRSPSRTILLCGVLDPRAGRVLSRPDLAAGTAPGNQVRYTPNARIFFREDLVCPLFEASLSSSSAFPRQPATGATANSRGRYVPKKVPERIPDKKKKRGRGPRTRPARATPPSRSAVAFLARRACRRRQA